MCLNSYFIKKIGKLNLQYLQQEGDKVTTR
jgi:hypothetical protein